MPSSVMLALRWATNKEGHGELHWTKDYRRSHSADMDLQSADSYEAKMCGGCVQCEVC